MSGGAWFCSVVTPLAAAPALRSTGTARRIHSFIGVLTQGPQGRESREETPDRSHASSGLQALSSWGHCTWAEPALGQLVPLGAGPELGGAMGTVRDKV